MHNATRTMATVANTYASQVPFPASAHTSGIVAAGVVVGAIVETDCARVSMGDRIPRRKPKSAVEEGAGGVGSICCGAPVVFPLRLGWDCTLVSKSLSRNAEKRIEKKNQSMTTEKKLMRFSNG